MARYASVGAFLAVCSIAVSSLGFPLGLPPAPEEPALAAVAPPDCLAYVALAGSGTPDAKSTNRTEQLLAEPEVRKLLAAIKPIIQTAVRSSAEKKQPGSGEVAAELLDLGMELSSRPAAAFLSKMEFPSGGGPPALAGGLIIHLGDDAQKTWSRIVKQQEKLGPAVETVKIGEGTWYRMQPAGDAPELTWGLHGKYLVVGMGAGQVEGILARIGQQPPGWLSAVRNRLAIARPAMLAFVNVRSIVASASERGGPQVASVLKALGLANLTALAITSGLDADGYVSKTLLGVYGEAEGIAGVLKQKPLTAADLAPLPKDALIAAAFRMDLAVAWQKGLAIASAIDPKETEQFNQQLAASEAQIGLKIEDDILKPLGDVWCFSAAPAGGASPLPQVLAVIQVRDSKRLAATQEKLVALAAAAKKNASPDASIPMIARSQLAGREVFSLQFAQPVPVMPSWCLTDKELVFAISPQAIQAWLGQGSGSGSLAEAPAVAAQLHGDTPPFGLVYQDSPAMVRAAYPMIQMYLTMFSGPLRQQGIELDPTILPSVDSIVKHMRPAVTAIGWNAIGLQTSSSQTFPGETMLNPSNGVMAALLLPAVQAAREAARRAQSMNNLKLIGLALHNYHDANKTLPPAYTTGKDGRPGLSWRVLILPYIGEQELFEQFRLDEPWDSEHNKPLAARIPKVYVSPNYAGPAGKTIYLGIGGERGVFGGKEGVPFAKIKDGTANTIAVVEGNNESAIEWTKPDVFVPDDADPTKGLKGLRPGGFNALMCDGSVRFMSEKILPQTLKAMFTRDGGESVNRQ